MNLFSKAVRGSAVLTLGEGVGYGASFVRNMILARLLTTADFGIAATFAMVILLLEMSSKLGIARFVVRDKEADDPEFMASAHLVQGASSVFSGLVMAALAQPLARLFGLQEQIGSLLVLACVPVLNGMTHLDTRRFERELRFGPSMWVEVIPQLVITVLAWPLAHWLRDYRVILALLIIKAVLGCAISYSFAEQPYRWRIHPEYTRRMLRFGWPLLLNGFLTFFIVRGDQFVVATFFSKSELGPYAAAAALTMAPTLFFTRVFASVMLPIMAKAQDDPVGFARRYSTALAGVSSFTIAYAVSLIVGADAFMRLAFGEKYVGTGILLAALTAVNALRTIRLAPAIAAIAKGDSMNQLISNLCGGLTLALAFALAFYKQPLQVVACAGLAGESLACVLSLTMLSRRDGVPLSRNFGPALLIMASLGVAALGNWFLAQWQAHPIFKVCLALVAGCSCGVIATCSLEASRAHAKKFLDQHRNDGWRGWLRLLSKNKCSARPEATAARF
jgi:O-antigen/teichoic acid export membrane protein